MDSAAGFVRRLNQRSTDRCNITFRQAAVMPQACTGATAALDRGLLAFKRRHGSGPGQTARPEHLTCVAGQVTGEQDFAIHGKPSSN
jgi:hypothetical protein